MSCVGGDWAIFSGPLGLGEGEGDGEKESAANRMNILYTNITIMDLKKINNWMVIFHLIEH